MSGGEKRSFNVKQYLQQEVAAFQEKVFFRLEDEAETEETLQRYLRSLFKKSFNIIAFSTPKELNIVTDTSMPTIEIQTPVNPLKLEKVHWVNESLFIDLDRPKFIYS